MRNTLRGLGTQVAWGIWPALASEKGKAGMGGSRARATERRPPSRRSVRDTKGNDRGKGGESIVRLRLTKIDEYQFLTCLKHGL